MRDASGMMLVCKAWKVCSPFFAFGCYGVAICRGRVAQLVALMLAVITANEACQRGSRNGSLNRASTPTRLIPSKRDYLPSGIR